MKAPVVLAIMAFPFASFAAADEAKPPAPAAKNPSFERLKSLEGTWTGTSAWDEGGQKGNGELTIVYKVTAAGNTVQETMFPGTSHEMVTMYHMDGADVVLTHYCAGGNQPRMKLEASKEPNVLSFRFVGGTNMKETDQHMHSARVTIVDSDHIKGTWTSMKDGKPSGDANFDLARKK